MKLYPRIWINAHHIRILGKGFYLTTSYGDIGSEEADAFCIGRLLPERLAGQYCFRTDNALACLEYVGSETVCKN